MRAGLLFKAAFPLVLTLLAACQKPPAPAIESEAERDAKILSSLQGPWRSTKLNCSDMSSRTAPEIAESGNEIRFDGKRAILRSVKTNCHTDIRMDVKVEKGILSWTNARIARTTCQGRPAAPMGDLKFEVETHGSFLKLDPVNRGSIPCGVLVRKAFSGEPVNKGV